MRLSLNKLTVFKWFLHFLHKFQQIFGIIIVSIREFPVHNTFLTTLWTILPGKRVFFFALLIWITVIAKNKSYHTQQECLLSLSLCPKAASAAKSLRHFGATLDSLTRLGVNLMHVRFNSFIIRFSTYLLSYVCLQFTFFFIASSKLTLSRARRSIRPAIPKQCQQFYINCWVSSNIKLSSC